MENFPLNTETSNRNNVLIFFSPFNLQNELIPLGFIEQILNSIIGENEESSSNSEFIQSFNHETSKNNYLLDIKIKWIKISLTLLSVTEQSSQMDITSMSNNDTMNRSTTGSTFSTSPHRFLILVIESDTASSTESVLNSALNQLFQMHENVGTPPASEKIIDGLQTITIDSSKIETCKACTICLENFEVDKGKIVELTCNHIFCKGCITSWLKIHNLCPLCRATEPEKEGNNCLKQSE